MSHYDCKDCGHLRGISYGLCEACTPREVFDLARALVKATIAAEREWDELTKVWRATYVAAKTAGLRRALDEALDRGKKR